MLQPEHKNSSRKVINDKQLDQETTAEGFKNVSLQVGDSGLPRNASTPTSLNARKSPQAESNMLEVVTENLEPICNVLEPRTNVCEINRGVLVDGKSSSVFVVTSPMDVLAGNTSWTIRPYARKEDKSTMTRTREWSVKLVIGDREIPQCTQNHSVPAILFSTGGYTGNHFHEFADIVIPLYTTSRKYAGEVQFLITNLQRWWIAKFQTILKGLSKYEVIDIDKEDAVHCFPSITVGLKRHPKDLTLDPSKYSYSTEDFREFLRNAYSLKRANAIRIRDGQRQNPRLLIISRRNTRRFTNPGEITNMATTLGYEVIVAEADKNLSRIAQVVNSCDVLMGVHGAGLTNLLFLPENAVLIQILPLGGFEWIATNYFGEPSKGMNLNYLEYKISKEESTLKNETLTARKGGWKAFQSVFLNTQNVKLDLNRFRPTLLKALELLH